MDGLDAGPIHVIGDDYAESTSIATTAVAEAVSLISCNLCRGPTETKYMTYNLLVSGVFLAVVGVIGLIGNALVVRVYLSKTQRVHSMSIYLASLAMSDFLLISTGLFLFVLEAWRHHGYPLIAWLYLWGAPLVFPLAAIFQTSSVYFCVAAAIDCFIVVVLPAGVKQIYCTPQRAKRVICSILVFCLIYNIPHAFEIKAVPCLDDYNQTSAQICPTDFRANVVYYTVYYTYMYTTFMAVGPLVLLIMINICVVYTVVRSRNASEESDTVSLILVVFFFIFCNSTALLVNFLETLIGPDDMLVYLVDLSNLLVVTNATANFFCYLVFGESFRRTLCEVLQPQKRKPIWVNQTITNGNGQTKVMESHTLL